MRVFEKNIISIYSQKGKKWIASLPQEVKRLQLLWNLSHLKPLDNLTCNYVLSGFQKEKPIILKLSLDALSLDRETKALEAFNEFGAVVVLDKEMNALLLEQAIPGYSLKKYSPKNGKKKIEVACNVVKRLHQAPRPKEGDFPHIEEWLATLDKEWPLPVDHLQKARVLKNELLKKQHTPRVLLHGDLHRDNILAHDEDWVVIDPKGVIGFPINELWAFVEDPSYDLNYIAEYFDYQLDDIVKWYYVHLILAACWQLEDNLSPRMFLELSKGLF